MVMKNRIYYVVLTIQTSLLILITLCLRPVVEFFGWLTNFGLQTETERCELAKTLGIKLNPNQEKLLKEKERKDDGR